MSDQPYRPRSRDRRVALGLFAGLVVVFGGAYVAGYVFTSDKVPRGATVAGVDIGGLQPAAAERALSDGLAGRSQEPIVVSASGKRFQIDPSEAGLGVDTAASVAQAGAGRSWSPARMWDYFSGGDDFDAVVTVDQDRLDQAVGSFKKQVDLPAKEGRVTFADGQADPHFPQAGRSLDSDGAADAVQGAYLETQEVVPLPVKEVQPEISEDEVHAAMDDFGNPSMSAPVILRIGGKNVVLRPSSYSHALSMKNQHGKLVPALDDKAVLRAIGPALKRVSLAPKDATVRLMNGRPKVVPAKKGVTVEKDAITGQFLSLVVQRGKHRTMPVKSVPARPDFTTSDARKLGVRRVVSSFTTQYPHAAYRNINLGRAAQLINGTLLKPGDTFSLNGTVGQRTKQNGFTKGYIISDGVYKEDYGGGVSQVATTTFNAAFFAGLQDVEHKPHSFYIDRYPIGREATVAWPSVDLKFKNTTPYGVLVQAGIKPSTPSTYGAMTVKMWSTKYWDITTSVSDRYDRTQPQTRHMKGRGCVPNDGYGGFDIDVYRYFHRHGKKAVARKEKMHTTYTPSDSVRCS